MNIVTLIGRLGKDPEMRMTKTGTSVCNMSIATNRADKDRTTDWHQIVMWGKAAEVAGRFLRKGSQCAVTGSLQYREYQDKNGNDRKVTEVHCNTLTLLGDGKVENSSGKQEYVKQERAPASEIPPSDDDVPF